MGPTVPLRAALLASALAVAAGCPPVRENVGGGEGGGDFLQSAFVALDPYTGTEYALAYVYLVDTEYNCASIVQNWGLPWWNLSSEISWVQASVFRGQLVAWESTFRSQYLWNQDGGFDYTRADFFSGGYGTGGYEYGDDDLVGDDDDPPPVGRDQQGSLGADALGAEDTLMISSWTEDSVRGSLRTAAGEWSFDALNCGSFGGGGGVDGDGTEPAEPEIEP